MSEKTKIGGFKTQIWHACGNDEIRPILNHAHVMNGFIYATNGHILVKQSLKNVHGLDDEQVAHLEGKSFHKDLLQVLDKQNEVTFKADGIHIKGKGIGSAVIEYSDLVGKFPNCYNVIPRAELAESVDYIGMSVQKINNLIKAMSFSPNNHFRFTFYGKDRAILVRGEEFDLNDEIGLIMPCRTEAW